MTNKFNNDSKRNSKVTLLGQLKEIEKPYVNIRKEKFDGIFNEHIRDCTKNGRQMSNLTMEEEKGMKSKLQISKANELSICLTDKSGKMCVVGRGSISRLGNSTHRKTEKSAWKLWCHLESTWVTIHQC